jgi:hypothetical protein
LHNILKFHEIYVELKKQKKYNSYVQNKFNKIKTYNTRVNYVIINIFTVFTSYIYILELRQLLLSMKLIKNITYIVAYSYSLISLRKYYAKHVGKSL